VQSIDSGFSINYIMMNFLGYLFYSIYNLYGYYAESFIAKSQIHTSDVLFAVHGFVLVCLHYALVMYYPRKDNRVQGLWLAICLAILITVGVYYLVTAKLPETILLMGLMKVVISFIKYVPQVYLNWKRKSTKGWSLENVILDLTGGVLSFIQIIIDYLDSGKLDNFSGNLNIAKFLLGIVTIVFDIIFLLQHYIVYPQKKGEEANYDRSEEEGEKDRTIKSTFNEDR